MHHDPAALSADAARLLTASVNPSTSQAREGDFVDFTDFTRRHHNGAASPQAVASYLAAGFFSRGWATGRVEQARSNIIAGLQLTLGVDWSHHPCISRITRACGRLLPKAAKYDSMWDLRLLFDYYKRQPDPNLRVDARRKALCLLRASIAARCGDILRISRRSIRWDDHGVSFQFFGWKTQATTGNAALSNRYRVDFLPESDRTWCAAAALRNYLSINQPLLDAAQHDQIWTPFNRPEPIKVGTVRSDCKKDMEAAGVPSTFGAATIRHAAISLWSSLGISREEVARRTGHRSLAVISFYYDKSQSTDFAARVAEQLRLESAPSALHDDFEDEDSQEDF